MSDWAQQRAMRGAAGNPISAEQKRDLVLLARRVYDAMDKRGDLLAGQTFDAWRRLHCRMAVERAGLRDCTNEDYLPLRAHFLGLLGARQAAERTRWAAANEPVRAAMFRLRREMEAARLRIGNPEAYVQSISRCKFKCLIEECNEKQLWTLVFDIRRAAQKRRKAGGVA